MIPSTRSAPFGSKSVQHKLGYQIERVQVGLLPNDWKPIPSLGAGVREIRVRDDGNAYRSLYLASTDQAVSRRPVLHVFQKKTRKTSSKDLAVAKLRLGSIR